jgi:glutathione synthase/RimK-type ligase-like ATP-grasp enzyme
MSASSVRNAIQTALIHQIGLTRSVDAAEAKEIIAAAEADGKVTSGEVKAIDAFLKSSTLCRHVLSGVDLKRRANGDYVLLEANSAPVYLDIEQKTGAPITARILDYLAATST